MKAPRFAWVGVHQEGVPALAALLAAGAPIHAVFTLPPELAARRSGAADYGPLCARYHIPLHQVSDINGPEARRLLEQLAPDIVFVLGWHQIVRQPALGLARVGMIGAHASMLPHNRGSAPVNWSIIRGEHGTGNSLFWLSEGVDEGDLIDQTPIPITPYDTCATVYEHVAASTRDMLLRALPRLLAGERLGRPQGKGSTLPLPRRRPADGLIDWSQPSSAVYDFVRALTRPYPGAFSLLDGQRWMIWSAALLPDGNGEAHRVAGIVPGQALGPIVSPVEAACGQLVACGTGTIALIEVESPDGEVLRGRDLSEQLWTGSVWGAGSEVPAGSGPLVESQQGAPRA